MVKLEGKAFQEAACGSHTQGRSRCFGDLLEHAVRDCDSDIDSGPQVVDQHSLGSGLVIMASKLEGRMGTREVRGAAYPSESQRRIPFICFA